MFQSAVRKEKRLSGSAIHVNDVCRMMKRRLRDAGLPEQLSPHSFRVTTITDLLEQGVPLEDVQCLAGHADPQDDASLRSAGSEDYAECRGAHFGVTLTVLAD